DLSSGQVVVALILLVLAVTLPQLAPVIVFMVMGKNAESALASMNVWLTRNQRMVNVVVLAMFGIVLLAQSLPELWG
ncbi:MAG: GAP family protein, partial [Acidimicrobiaceae bacterium]|nr:GAP family protein [Acidimicrobiaceae bacterium]